MGAYVCLIREEEYVTWYLGDIYSLFIRSWGQKLKKRQWKTTVVGMVEVAGEEGEAEAKNQKTLADFF